MIFRTKSPLSGQKYGIRTAADCPLQLYASVRYDILHRQFHPDPTAT